MFHNASLQCILVKEINFDCRLHFEGARSMSLWCFTVLAFFFVSPHTHLLVYPLGGGVGSGGSGNKNVKLSSLVIVDHNGFYCYSGEEAKWLKETFECYKKERCLCYIITVNRKNVCLKEKLKKGVRFCH